MSDVTATFGSLSSTNSSNSPADATSIGSGLGSNLREIQAHIAALRDGTAWGTLVLTSVAGTNTITATLASAGDITFGPTSYVTGSRFLLVPANTNTGATTLNITSPNGASALGAKNIFWNGAACSGGELVQNVPCVVEYDGTQFNIIGPMIGTRITNVLSGDVSLNNTASYFTGPTIAQGTVGTWWVTGSVTVTDSGGAARFDFKMWDGTTIISSGSETVAAAGHYRRSTFSGYITSPAGNIRIDVKDATLTTGSIVANFVGNAHDSAISAIRIA